MAAENGDTTRLIRQIRSLSQARAAWLAGDRCRARQLLLEALDFGDDVPDAEGKVSAPPAANGQAAGHASAEPEPQEAAGVNKNAEASTKAGD